VALMHDAMPGLRDNMWAWWQCYLDGAGEGTSGLFFPVCYLAEMWAQFSPVKMDDEPVFSPQELDGKALQQPGYKSPLIL
jgi:hypothetical protein